MLGGHLSWGQMSQHLQDNYRTQKILGLVLHNRNNASWVGSAGWEWCLAILHIYFILYIYVFHVCRNTIISDL